MSCIGAQAYVGFHIQACPSNSTLATVFAEGDVANFKAWYTTQAKKSPSLFTSLSVSPSMSLSLLWNPHWVVLSSQSGIHSLSHHLPPRSQQRHSGSLCCSFICSDLFFAHERLQLPEGSASQLLALKHSLKPKGVSAWMPRMYGCILLSFVSDV